MSQDQSAEIQNTPSHDDNAAPSTAPEAESNELNAEASATEKTDQPEKKDRFQSRINQLTTKNFEERQRSATLEARVKELESNKPAEPKPDLVAPNPDTFDTDQEYQTANAKYYADVSLKATNDRIETQDQEAAQQTQRDSIQAKKVVFEANLADKRSNFEDFEDVAYGHTFMDMDLAEQIFEMDKGPEVAYHLGSNLDEAERIFALTPIQRARELTKLEFQVEALKPKVVSDAPDPITPLGNSEAVEADPDKMSADEWQKWRNKKVHG